MEHTFKLQPQYFDFIQHGTKRIEIRLNDAKRQQIKVGDTIHFVRLPEQTQMLTAKVVDLLHYACFEDLLADYDIDILADKSLTKAKLLTDLNRFYTAADQARYGVVGIKIKLQ